MEREGSYRLRQRVLQKLVLLVFFGAGIYFLHTSIRDELTSSKAVLLLHISDLQNKVADLKREVSRSSVRAQNVAGGGCLNGGTKIDGKCKCLPGYGGDICDQWTSGVGGAWSVDLHMQERYHDPVIVETALKLIKEPVTSVMDVGCGLGLYLGDFHRLGTKRCVGVEPSPMDKDPESPFYSGDCKQFQIDAFALNQPEVDLKETFDVVMSVEVVEHIDREKHTRFFNFLTKHAKHTIIFSGAYKDQGGIGHISERPWEEWKQEFESRGWIFDETASESLRKVSKYPWFRSNLAIFKKK